MGNLGEIPVADWSNSIIVLYCIVLYCIWSNSISLFQTGCRPPLLAGLLLRMMRRYDLAN